MSQQVLKKNEVFLFINDPVIDFLFGVLHFLSVNCSRSEVYTVISSGLLSWPFIDSIKHFLTIQTNILNVSCQVFLVQGHFVCLMKPL
jgi:hypothetical protein